ncbi:MAG: hypothetical protein QXO93_05285 [Acidilobaceae archaeon]
MLRFVVVLDGVDYRVVDAAVRLLESSFPRRLSRDFIEKARARALRYGYWWRAPEDARAIIVCALNTNIRVFRGFRVVSVLVRALARVELYSMRGIIALLGLTYGIPRGFLSLESVLAKINYVIYLGRRVLESLAYLYPKIRVPLILSYA